MQPGRIARPAVLALGLAGAAWAAGEAPLTAAAEKGNAALVRTLLHAGDADANAAQGRRHDRPPLGGVPRRPRDGGAAGAGGRRRRRGEPLRRAGAVLAATNGNAALVGLLLDAGADPDASLRGGETRC